MRFTMAMILLASCAAQPPESSTRAVTTTTPQARTTLSAEPSPSMLADEQPASAAPPASPPDERFVPALRQAAASYRGWGRVDERPNLAPTLCRMPRPEDYGAPSQVRLSKALASLHGQKLYYLWASSKRQYLDLARLGKVPVGFAIVKESFAASDEPPAGEPQQISFSLESPPPPITSLDTPHGRRYTGASTGLYIMTKVADGDADGTDEGWVYGTIAPDGTVTSGGRVEHCMGCHEHTDHDRLFGLRPAS
jgi:hypothetical protein